MTYRNDKQLHATAGCGLLKSSLAMVVVGLALLAISSCQPFFLTDLLDGESGLPLTVTPNATVVVINQTLDFGALGGFPPYSFSVASGLGTIDPATGLFTAPPSDGTTVIRVTDSVSATADAEVTVALNVTTDINYDVDAVVWESGTTANGSVDGYFTVTNIGADPGAAAVDWTVFASTNTTFEPGDYYVDSGTFPALLGGDSTTYPPGVSFSGTWPSSTGNYWLIAVVSAIPEDLTPVNNWAATGSFTAVSGPPPDDIDYTVTAVNTSTSGVAGEPFAGTFDFQNNGLDPGSADVFWVAYLSANASLDGSDTVFDSFTEGALSPLPATGSGAYTGTWPTTGSSYWIIIDVTAADDVAPGNDVAVSAEVTVSPPDVVYSIDGPLAVPGGTTAGGPVSGSFDFTNGGSDDGSSTVHWTAYASKDDNDILDVDDVIIAQGTRAALNAGMTSIPSVTYSGLWPTIAGDYYVIITLTADDDTNPVDPELALFSPVTLSGPPAPDVDYVVTDVTHMTGTVVGESFDFEFTYDNSGTDDGTASVFWTAYVSPNDVFLDGDNTIVATGEGPPLALVDPPEVVPFTTTWPGALATPAPYWIIVDVSASDDTTPGNDFSETAGSVTVTAPQVNYAVSGVVSSGGQTIGGPLTGNFDVDNIDVADGAETLFWTALVSDNATFGGDRVIDSGTLPPLATGGSHQNNPFSGTWNPTGGSQWIFVTIDTADDIASGDDVSGSAAVTISAPDYFVNSVSVVGNPALGGSLINETFTVTNQDPIGDGSSTIYWTAYVSVDAALGVGDYPIDSGSTSGLSASQVSSSISIDNGAWPTVSSSTNYHLIVSVSASDELPGTTGDNETAEMFTVDVPDIDYEVTAITNSGSPAETDTAIVETLSIQNTGIHDGSTTVFWYAYISDDQILDAGDGSPIDSGFFAGLTSGNSNGDTINGTWPSTVDDYYLLVRVSAADESDTTNNDGASGVFEINASPADIDYIVTSVTSNFTTVTTGSPLSEYFDIRNAGGAAGAANVDYEVFASADDQYGGPDVSLGFGTLIGGLPGGASSVDIPMSGAWSVLGGFEYFLIVVVNAIDETGPVDSFGAAGPFTVDNPPDYTISAVDFPITVFHGNRGELFTNASTDHGGAPDHTFDIENTVGSPGKQTISWNLYQSDDQLLGGDVLLDGGTIPALAAAPDSSTIAINSGLTLPDLPDPIGAYYYIVTISAGDDSDTTNNTCVIGPIYVWDPVPKGPGPSNTETDSLDDDLTAAESEDYFIVLNPGDVVQIEGAGDDTSLGDYFRIRTGPGTTALDINLTWDGVGDDLDLYLYDAVLEVDPLVTWINESVDTDNGSRIEPLTAPPWIAPVAGASTYYLNVYVFDSGGPPTVGDPYYLTIVAP